MKILDIRPNSFVKILKSNRKNVGKVLFLINGREACVQANNSSCQIYDLDMCELLAVKIGESYISAKGDILDSEGVLSCIGNVS